MKFSLPLLVFSLTASPQAAPTPVQSAVQTYVQAHKDQAKPAFRHFVTDLNGDQIPDAVVLLQSANWCGSGGCTLLVFQGTAKGLKLLSDSTVTDAPIWVLSEKKQGWKSLVVYSKGRGAVVMSFNGKGYPQNPSMQPLVNRTQLQTAQIGLK